MLEKNMYDTDTVPDLLAVILEEDAVEWLEIQQDKELFLKSPVLDYEQELFESWKNKPSWEKKEGSSARTEGICFIDHGFGGQNVKNLPARRENG